MGVIWNLGILGEIPTVEMEFFMQTPTTKMVLEFFTQTAAKLIGLYN